MPRPAKLLPFLAAAITLSACHAHGQPQSPAPGASEAFMKKTAQQPGVITLPSGLEYKIEKSGPAGGLSPKDGDEVKVNYEGKLVDGTVFDSSYKTGEPVVFPVGSLVPAWNEALPLMHPGDIWTLYVPPALGYGPDGKGPIPPDSVMIFKIELLGVLPHDASANG